MSLRAVEIPACMLGILLAAGGSVSAGTVSLGWDAAIGVTGYRVYYGPASGQYTNVEDVGNVTQATIGGLTDCTTWFLAVKALNSAGESVNFSAEISGWVRPTVTLLSPAAATQGDRLTLDVTGLNYQTGATVEIDNPGISLASTAVLDCGHVQALATIEPTAGGVRPAEVGTFTLTVINPDQVFGSLANAFEVRIDPARFDINTTDPTTLGRVDGKDTVWLSRLFGSREGDLTYDADADLNGDGWIDGEDLAFIASNFGRCWSGTTWTVAACPASIR